MVIIIDLSDDHQWLTLFVVRLASKYRWVASLPRSIVDNAIMHQLAERLEEIESRATKAPRLCLGRNDWKQAQDTERP